MIIIVLLLLIAFVLSFYIFSLRTNNVRRDFSEYKNNYIAHRGLFNNTDFPENSISAFVKAVDSGYGIELDVQLTKDGEAVVFHDDNLYRICESEKKLCDLTYNELSCYSLLRTEQRIPLFSEVLNTVNGKVPMIIEVKPSGNSIKTLKKTLELLKSYNGEYCIESFDPKVIYYLKKNYPEIKRGILSNNFLKSKGNTKAIPGFLASNLLYNFIIKPDFIAYNHNYFNQFSYKICRKLYRPVNVAWTVRSEEELIKAKKVFDIIIFDGFIPKK